MVQNSVSHKTLKTNKKISASQQETVTHNCFTEILDGENYEKLVYSDLVKI